MKKFLKANPRNWALRGASFNFEGHLRFIVEQFFFFFAVVKLELFFVSEGHCSSENYILPKMSNQYLYELLPLYIYL